MKSLGQIALLVALVLFAVPAFAQEPLLGEAGADWMTDDIPTLWYNPAATTYEGVDFPAGILQVFAARVGGDAAAKVNMTSLNITSDPTLFVGGVDKTGVNGLGDAFDNYDEGNLFKATFGGSFNDVAFTMKAGGGVMNAGLSAADIIAAFMTTGSTEGGGALPRMDLVVVPEPSALALLGLGVVGLLAWRRRR